MYNNFILDYLKTKPVIIFDLTTCIYDRRFIPEHVSSQRQQPQQSLLLTCSAGSTVLLVVLFLKERTTRSVTVSSCIMQLTCGCCTWCKADNLGNPLALLESSRMFPSSLHCGRKLSMMENTGLFQCSGSQCCKRVH